MSKKNLIAAAIVAALSTGTSLSGMISAFAEGSSPDSSAAPAEQPGAPARADKDRGDKDKTETDLIKVSEDALATMQSVVAARLAIFNGEPDNTKTFVADAQTQVAAAIKDADKYALDIDESSPEDLYVPFDANLTVSEDFTPSPENMKHIAKANEHLRKGEKKEAMKVLKLGEVDVAVETRLMPVNLAKKQIEEANKLVDEGKYYEANLALKAIDDAVVVDTFAVDEAPKVKKGS